MNCQQVEKYMLDYCDDKLSPEIKKQIEDHVQNCTNCAANMALTKLENKVLNNLPAYEPADGFTNRVMQKVFVTTPGNNTFVHYVKKSLIFVLPITALLLVFLLSNLPSGPDFGLKTSPPQISEKAASNSIPETIMREKEEVIKNVAPEPPKAKNSLDNNSDYKDTSTRENDSISDAEPSAVNTRKSINSEAMSVETSPPHKDKLSESSRAQNAEPLSLAEDTNIKIQPQNIPDNFTLNKVNKVSSSEIVYHYYDSTRQISLDIELRKFPFAELENKSFTPLQATDSPENSNADDIKSNINCYSWELTDESNFYIISLKSHLSHEELMYLSSEINIKRE